MGLQAGLCLLSPHQDRPPPTFPSLPPPPSTPPDTPGHAVQLSPRSGGIPCSSHLGGRHVLPPSDAQQSLDVVHVGLHMLEGRGQASLPVAEESTGSHVRPQTATWAASADTNMGTCTCVWWAGSPAEWWNFQAAVPSLGRCTTSHMLGFRG